MQKIIKKEKIEKYREITTKALEIARESIKKSREAEAKEIILTVESYISDSTYFQNKGDFVNAFAALNYAHGWLDAGSKLGIFDTKDSKLFTIK